MRLYRRRKSNGEWVWWASWSGGEGRTIRRSTRCTTKPAAEIVVARWERELADPVYAAAQSATFGVESGRFLKACEGAVERKKMAPETLGMYRQKAGTLVRILEANGPLRLALIDASTFQSFLDARRAQFFEDRKRPITESNLYKEWVTYHQILKGAWRGQRFSRDPRSLKPEHFGVEYKPRDTFLTEAEADALLEELKGDRRRTVAFVLGTGARRREWERAQPGDLKADEVHLRGTKTEKSDRTIPILRPTEKWAQTAEGPFPLPSWPNARRDIHAACDRAKVPRVTWNDLRRTFASKLALAGIQSDVGRRMMGHGSEVMWNLVYARASTAGLREMAERQLREPSVNRRKSNRAQQEPKGRT
jgi:site-specific recombinase XerD